MDWDLLKSTQAQAISVARVVKLMPLDAAIQFLAKAEEMGPYIDPTGWMKNSKTYRPALRMFRAAKHFATEVEAAIEDLRKAGAE